MRDKKGRFIRGHRQWLGKKRPNLLKTGSTKTMFKKGHKTWNKGRAWSNEIKKKLSISHLGKNAGEKNWRWKGGIYPERLRLRFSRQMKEWAIKVKERDNYTCQICNKRGGKLNSHHIKPFALYPELSLDLINGITLCVNCHRKTSVFAGNKYNPVRVVMPYA